jgi:hypothetical protein
MEVRDEKQTAPQKKETTVTLYFMLCKALQ